MEGNLATSISLLIEQALELSYANKGCTICINLLDNYLADLAKKSCMCMVYAFVQIMASKDDESESRCSSIIS